MKKDILFLGLALALAGCGSDTYEDWGNPQTSGPETEKNVQLAISNAADINFGTLTADSVQLFVPTVSTENATVQTNSYTVVVYNADKTTSATMQADANGKVLASDFKTNIETLYGKAPATRNVALDIQGFATTADGVTIKNTGSAQANVTVVAPFIDEGGYYLVGDMFTAWDKDHAHAFTHVGSGDVYDNPEFQIVFQTTADNQYWKIIPANNYNGDFWKTGEQGVVGVLTDGDDSPSGNLATGDNPGAGKIAKAGYHRMTINMMNYTYKIEDLNFGEYIYEIGNEGGWSTSHPLWGGNFDGLYVGYYYLNGEYKFKPNADNWDGDYGQNPNGAAGTLVQEGEVNCPDPGAGFYRISVSLADLTYSLLKIDQLSIIGAFNEWNGDVDLTFNPADNAWEASNVSLPKTGGLKFRVNHDWTYSFGGSLDALTEYNGADITVEAGTYDVKVYLDYNNHSHAVLTKK